MLVAVRAEVEMQTVGERDLNLAVMFLPVKNLIAHLGATDDNKVIAVCVRPLTLMSLESF